MISPKDNEALALRVRAIYEQSERVILERIAKRLAQDIRQPDWEIKKLNQIAQLRAELQREMKFADNNLNDVIQEIVMIAYQNGKGSMIADLKEIYDQFEGDKAEKHEQLNFLLEEMGVPEIEDIEVAAAAVLETSPNVGAVTVLAGKLANDVRQTHMMVVREVEDIYRSVISETVGTVLTGAETRLQAAQRALDKFAAKGITGFRDKSGRRWNLASYTEMATRSNITQAAIQGHIDQSEEYGFNLQIVDDHRGTCDICAKWEGKILSTEEGSKYPTVAKARAGGLFHPNCTHNLQLYIKGWTEVKTPNHPKQEYKDRQRQRYIERAIREANYRVYTAMSADARKEAMKELRHWKQQMNEHMEGKDFPRKRERERMPNTAR